MNLSFLNHQSVFQLIILLGALIACVVTIGLLFLTNLRQRDNVYLVLFIFSLGMNNLSNYMIDINLHELFPIIPLLPLPLTLLIPVSFYFHLQITLDRSFKISVQEKILIFLVFMELLFYLTLMTIYGIQESFITQNTSFTTKIFQLKEFVAIFLTVVLSIDIVLKVVFKPIHETTRYSVAFGWAKVVFASSMLIVISWTVSYVYGFLDEDFSRKVYYPIWCISTFVIFFSGWYGLKKERITSAVHVTDENDNSKERDDLQLLRLRQIVNDRKLYKRRITLKELSENSGISSGRITKLLKGKMKTLTHL